MPECVRFPWLKGGKEGVPLTGTLFEYLDVRSRRLRREIAVRSGLFEEMYEYYEQLRYLTTFFDEIHKPRERPTNFLPDDPEVFRDLP